MNRHYWEKIAPKYNDEIFDVLRNDRKGLIVSAVRKFASPQNTVMDIGCAIGKWLPVLSPLFKKVVAVDISAKNLEIAKTLYPLLKNVSYRRADMSSPRLSLPRTDFAICINAILTDSVKKRDLFLKNVSGCLKKGGNVIIVVPSLESWLHTRIVQRHWKIDKTLFAEKTSVSRSAKKYQNIQDGNADIDQVPTKHYLKEELQLLLSVAGFHAHTFRKIEYTWDTEFVKPPDWLKDPYPWDWMVVAEKKS
jgi:ubiquinone/menaquinone biosynthesis C-methylase UbiE